MAQNVKGETDHCRGRLLKYCNGQGLDLGCGNVKLKPDAIAIDLHSPIADMQKDARKLDYYPDEQFDYVFSSHLLEEFQDTEPVLREWLRVIKPGGHLVLYQADKDLYFPIGNPNCNPRHKHHFGWEDLWAILQKLGTEIIHHARYSEEPHHEWSFELVVKKSTAGESPVQEIIQAAPIEAKPSQIIVQAQPLIDEVLEGISILVPTLNRPKSVAEFIAAVQATAKHPDRVEIVFGIHDDDKASREALAQLQDTSMVDVTIAVIDRYPDGKIHLANLWNQLYPKTKYQILGYFGDDVIFKTPGWDDEVCKEFAKDRNILLCCNDVHVQRGKQATLFFTHKSTHEKLGFYLPPKFRRWYMDTFLDVVYRNCGKLHYREDIVTEHMHPDVFPERMDDTYRTLGGHTAPGGLKDQDKAYWISEENRKELSKCIAILKAIG